MEPPLHSLNPTTRFSGRAEDYAHYRPGYPAEAADAILAGLGPPSLLTAADIGAGTGISARWLADRGVRIIAIEPNEPMRRAAQPAPLVEWRAGRAEATGLADSSVDLIVCAQAFHWFEPEPTLAEFARVLKPGGRVALVWNTGDRTDALTNAYYEAIEAAAQDPAVVHSRGAMEVLQKSSRFINHRELTFRHTHVLNEDGVVGRALSASYVPREGPVAERMIEEIREGYRRHGAASGGIVYTTRVFLAERA